MLIRRAFVVLALVGTLSLVAPSAARADGSCDQTQSPWCQVDSGTPGGPGTGGGGTGGGCTWNGAPVVCQDPDFGFYTGNGCYMKVANPPPFPPLAGHTTGGWYIQSCLTSPGSTAVTQSARWVDNPPAAGPTPEQLAQQALAKIHLLGAQVGVAPNPTGSGLVGLPVWLWTAVTAGTWGPQTASATGGGITVTITAKAQRIVWSMGDGQSVTCANPGTAYQAKFGNAPSPTCGYRYAAPSSTAAHPHGRYRITATTFWSVEWSGGGQTGVLTPSSQSATSVEIGEVQVVTQ